MLRTVNNDKRVTIELRDEETNALLDRWFRYPDLLLAMEEVKNICHAHVDEIVVDSEGDILITILIGAEG